MNRERQQGNDDNDDVTIPRNDNDDIVFGTNPATKNIILTHEYPEITSYLNPNSKSSGDIWTTWTVNSQTINSNAAQLKTG